VKPTTRFIL